MSRGNFVLSLGKVIGISLRVRIQGGRMWVFWDDSDSCIDSCCFRENFPDKYRFGENTKLNQTWVYVTALLLTLSSGTEKCWPTFLSAENSMIPKDPIELYKEFLLSTHGVLVTDAMWSVNEPMMNEWKPLWMNESGKMVQGSCVGKVLWYGW